MAMLKIFAGTFSIRVAYSSGKCLKLTLLDFCIGEANPTLAQQIASQLGQQLGKIELSTFPDGETKVEIIDPIHGHDVFVIQVRRLFPPPLLALFCRLMPLFPSLRLVNVIFPLFC